MTTPTGTPSVFGGTGKLEFAPTSGPDDPFPTWVDITSYLRTEESALAVTRGRQSELDSIQSSQLTCILDNTDGRFTYGLTTGPYGANWAPAKQFRYSETIGARTFYLFQGNMEYPDVDNWQPIGYQQVSLTCTDRLTRLSRGRPFISTLAAHIQTNGGTALQAYYPLNETASPVSSVVGTRWPLTTRTIRNAFGFNPDSPPQPSITYTNAAPPYGDDISVVTFQPSRDSTSPHTMIFSIELNGFLSVPLTLAAGQVLTLVAWVNLSDYDGAGRFVQIQNSVGSGAVSLGLDSPAGIPFSVFGIGPGWGSATVDGGPVRTGVWTPVAARVGFSPATCELWVKDDIYTVAMPTSGPTTTSFDQLFIGRATNGAIGHVQVYIGAPGDWDRTKFLAQVRMGFSGLEYQSTGQRINTLLDYAGVPSGQRAIDPGQSFMQKATLAGQDPGSALANAVGTERGRGFIDGTGSYVFHDRIRVYNV